jgi:hypothetical protein
MNSLDSSFCWSRLSVPSSIPINPRQTRSGQRTSQNSSIDALELRTC